MVILGLDYYLLFFYFGDMGQLASLTHRLQYTRSFDRVTGAGMSEGFYVIQLTVKA